jgi:hypothetical protein
VNSSLRITTSPGSPWAPGRRDWDGRFESEQGDGPHCRLQQLRSRTAGGWRAYTPFVKVPENRVYVSVDGAEDFLHSFLASSGGRVVSDEATASGIEIGQPQITFRRIQVESTFGKLVAFVTDGKLPYPYGRETTGYEVADLTSTIEEAQSLGVKVLVPPTTVGERTSAIAQFPGGYIAEIHSIASPTTHRLFRPVSIGSSDRGVSVFHRDEVGQPVRAGPLHKNQNTRTRRVP